MFIALVVDDDIVPRKIAQATITKYCNPALTHKNVDPEQLIKLHPFNNIIKAEACDSHDAAITFFAKNFADIKVIVMDYNLGKGQTGASVLQHMRTHLEKMEVAPENFPYLIPNSSDSNQELSEEWPAERILSITIKPGPQATLRRASLASAPPLISSSSYETALGLLASDKKPTLYIAPRSASATLPEENDEGWQSITSTEAWFANHPIRHAFTPIPMSAVPVLSVTEATPSNSPAIHEGKSLFVRTKR